MIKNEIVNFFSQKYKTGTYPVQHDGSVEDKAFYCTKKLKDKQTMNQTPNGKKGKK